MFIITVVLKATAIFVATWAVASLLRNRSAAIRHLVWSAGLVAVLTVPLLSVSLPWQVSVSTPLPAEFVASFERTSPPATTPSPVPDQGVSADAESARAVLAAARGAPALLCAIAERSVENAWGRWSYASPNGAGENEAARWVLSERPNPEAVTVLLEGLHQPDACVQSLSARLLARARTDQARNGLRDALRATTPGTRLAGAVGLGLSDDHASVPALIDILDDREPSVRGAVAWALGPSKTVAP